METNNIGKTPLWAKLRNAKTRIKALESREKSLLTELERQRTLCERLQAERDNWQTDCKALQKRADMYSDSYSRALALLEDATAKNASAKTWLDYSGLDNHFREKISLSESKQSVMEASTVLAMIPHTGTVDERASYCHTIAECLWEYTKLLNKIGER